MRLQELAATTLDALLEIYKKLASVYVINCIGSDIKQMCDYILPANVAREH